MAGGLIQLITTGIEDSPLINNPEITFFKKIYKQYTPFSLYNNNRFIDNIQFDKEYVKIIEKNGDLLYNQYFKIEIPNFNLTKIIKYTDYIKSNYNINYFKIKYNNILEFIKPWM
jgi:hypothetical protein